MSALNPRLFAVSGPMRDTIFILSKEEVPVGRDPSNLLSISDPALSRRHCAIHLEGEHYAIQDLESRNGTFVNGTAVQKQRLRHGDQISVGDSVFVFLLKDETEKLSSEVVEFDDGDTLATEQLRPQDVLYLHSERVFRELPAHSRVAQNLNVLLKIGRVVHTIRDLRQLQDQILAQTFEVVPAERGAILLEPNEFQRFDSVFARHRAAAIKQPVRVSRTITRQVLEQGIAVLAADVPGSGRLSGVESLVVSNIRSLLCVPLTVFKKVTGCVYLDTTNSADRFDKDHLQLLAAIAGIAAVALDNARRLQWLEQENVRLNTESNLEHSMVGESARMKEVYQFLTRVAPANSTVLIEGESGTGKELAARAIHRSGPRSSKPFVAINCGAIPEGLVESELFGHEKGAFTGASVQKKGRLELAAGGVVFLDEIGELSPAMQVKLLRVIQEREFERLGGTRSLPLDVRFIAASNRDMEQEVKTGAFRRDLYYRLNVVSLTMPSLRERRDDIPSLVEYFVAKYSSRNGVQPKRISREALACLVNYDWPGNVRELENAIERALVLGSSEIVRPEDLPESILEKDPPAGVIAGRYHNAVTEHKKELIIGAVQEARGNYTEAARILGLHPNYLHRLIKNLELKDGLRSSVNG
jgi:transcriptional regulator with GAF, ATPase, and Fis domain